MSVYRKRTGRKNININSENSLDNKITVLKNYMSNSKDIKDRRFKVGGKMSTLPYCLLTIWLTNLWFRTML